MRFLLDTHTLIWFITDHPNLSNDLKLKIKNTNVNQPFASIASLWEIGIKVSLKKLDISISIEELFEKIELSPLTIKPITPETILSITKLPFHHRDPFDRIIIAQAQTENLTIITKDPWFSSYEVKTAWN